MAAQEYTLTKGSDTVTTSSSATRDYLLTQGWAATTTVQQPPAPATAVALEERVVDLEEEGLYGAELLYNQNFRDYPGAGAPAFFTGFWSGGATESKDTTVLSPLGLPTWKAAIPSGAFHRFGTQRFTVREQDILTIRFRARADHASARFQVELQSTDGRTDPNFFSTDVTSQSSAQMSYGAGVGVFKDFSAQITVPRGHRLARIYISADCSVASAIQVNMAQISCRSWSEPNVHLPPGYRLAVTDMSLGAGWGVYATPWGDSCGFTKRNGLVIGRGLLTIDTGAGATFNQTILTLPVGWRPISNLILPCEINDGNGQARIYPNGTVQVTRAAAGLANWLSLGGLWWPADA